MAVNKITLKKVVVGTPIKTVTAGSAGIQNLGGVTTTGQVSGSILAFNQSTGNYEIANFTGDSNMFVTYDSSSSPDTFQLNFTNDSVSGNLIPRLDSAQDLGSATKKWKDLFLSGGTINIGSLKIRDENGNFVVKDNSGGVVLTNPKFIRQRDSDNILSYDSATSTFTFDDSDVARTDINETFHKNVTISGDLTVSGTTTTVNTETINLADNLILINSNHTGSPSQDGGIEINRGSSANKTFVWDETNDRWSVGSETLYSTGLVRGGQVVGDSGTISNLASTTHTASTITANNTTSVNVTSTNLVAGVNATFDSATIGNLSITNMLASSGDSATFTNIANTQFTGSQATIDSATIGNLNADSSDIRQVSTEFINFDSAFGDSATITNLANTQLTASQITADSATINTLNVDSSDVRQISTEFINFDSAFGDSATVTNLATTQLTVANANIDSANITNLSSTNFTMSSGDSATITNIANTQLTGSQATLDSATITKLNVDSADIDHFSTENINFDSATGDSATITNIASANINADQLFTDSATITNIANSVLTAKAITNTTLVGDSATIGNVAVTTQLTGNQASFDSIATNTIHASAVTIDSATIGNLATTQITLSQVTADSATINTINADSSDIRQFSTEFINADSAFIDSATIGGIALGNNDLVTTGKLYYANVFSSEGDLPDANSHHGMFAHVHGTGKGYFAHAGAWHQLLDKSSANDSATITNLASGQLTVDNATFDSSAHNTIHAGAVTIDSATIINLANTQFTSSQITSDSATINTLNADSSDIRQFSTEFINFDSAFGDSATITNIANSVLTAKVITGDSATVTNIASSQLTIDNASFDSVATNTLLAGSLTVDEVSIDGDEITVEGANSPTLKLKDTTQNADLRLFAQNSNVGIGTFSNHPVQFYTNSTNVLELSNGGDVILDSSGAIQYDKSDKALEFGDNYKATFGSGTDLQIYHDGVSSYIKDAGTGTLRILSDEVRIYNAAETKIGAQFIQDGEARLRFNNITKLATKTDGVEITGLMASTTATADSGTIGNLATTQITGSQATFDSADIGNLRTTGVLQTDSVNATQLELLTGVTNVPAHKEGRLFYDDSNKTIGFYSDVSGLVHEVGIEEHQRVYNSTGSTIAKGKPVYFSGNYTGGAVDVPTVALADATDTAKYNAQGLTAVAIPNNSYGYIQTSGQLSGLDTSGLTAGQKVFVGLGSGLLSNTTPLYPNYPICLGWCVSSNASTGVILLNRQAHTIDSLRVVTSGHIGSNLQIDGNLTVLGSTTSVSSADLTAGTPMFRLNEGNAIGEAGTTFSGTGLDDAFYSGFFTGTTNQNYYVRIDGVGTGAGGVDTFEVAFGADSTFSSPVLTKQVITGSPQMIHSTDNISINFASTTGHDSGARWAGTAGPINVDTGFFSNRNTGTSGVGFTYVGIYYDVSDDKWKLIDEYDSNPSGSINEADASYSLGTLKLDTLEGNVTGNVTGNVSGTAATVTGAAQTNITSVGTLTGLAISGDLTLDSAGAVVYDKSEQALTFGDNHKAKFGTGGDLQIYHNGANSFIEDGGTGNLVIRSNLVDIQSADGSENLAKFTENSSVKLYFNGSEKLSTSNTGVSVTGLMASTTATADSATIGNLAVTNLVVSSGDSATITNIASSSINTNALQVDDITINSSTISDAGTITIDANHIDLDADGGNITFKDGGTEIGQFQLNDTNHFKIGSKVSDADIRFFGNDGGSVITPLILDMSAGGKAIFSNNIDFGDGHFIGDDADDNLYIASSANEDIRLDASGDIILDADGGDIIFKDGGTQFGQIANSSSDLKIISNIQDKDIIFRGNDNGSFLDALTLDMSAAGAATFNDQITLGGNLIHAGNLTLDVGGDITLDADGGDIKLSNGGTQFANFGDATGAVHIDAVVSDDDIKFRGVSDGTTFTALTLDMSDRGNATFSAGATFNRRTEISTDSDYQLRIDNGSNIWYNRVQGDGTYAIHLNGTGNILDATATGIGVTGNANVSGTLTVGNLNVDSADIIKIARDNLSTGQAGLTYDSSGGQFGLNANHVMALIQTVDSNGSGLNAATLDGQEGTHYRINVYDNSGTLLN